MMLYWEIFSGVALITCTIYTFLGRRWGRIEPAVLHRFRQLQERIVVVEQEMVQLRTGVTSLTAQRRNQYRQEMSSFGANGGPEKGGHHPSLNIASSPLS